MKNRQEANECGSFDLGSIISRYAFGPVIAFVGLKVCSLLVFGGLGKYSAEFQPISFFSLLVVVVI